MKTLLLSMYCGVLYCGVFLVSAGAVAQESKPPNENQTVHLINELVTDSAASPVQLRDVVLDLETGHAALQIVSWHHTDPAKPVIAVAPFTPEMTVEQASKLSKDLSPNDPASLTRKLAASLHSAFGQDVYWSKYIVGLQPTAKTKFDAENYELLPFSTLKNKKVVDIDGEPLGTLADIGIRDSGDIVYCVLQAADKTLRAIPLGAFVDRERNKDWKIELKREQVFQFSAFNPKMTPQEIERGWQEYVAVRYGRDTLQEASKASPPSKSPTPEAE